MKARSNSKQAVLTVMALLVPVAIFIAAAPTNTTSLKPPDKEPIPVAFLISDGAVVIDFCGPWEVFENATNPATSEDAFSLYTVAETIQAGMGPQERTVFRDRSYSTCGAWRPQGRPGVARRAAPSNPTLSATY